LKSKKELYEIAKDFYAGLIFSDRHLKSTAAEMASTFMPLALGATFPDVNDVGMIFEYLDKAGPRSINGKPMFMSLQMLTKTETDTMFDFLDKIAKADKKMKSEIEND